jgi:hypothetical protein
MEMVSGRRVAGMPGDRVVGISTRLASREQPQRVRWQADQRIVGKAHRDRMETPAQDPAALVQPGGQHPWIRVSITCSIQ